MLRARSLHRNAASAAISSAVDIRRSGARSTNDWRTCSTSDSAYVGLTLNHAIDPVTGDRAGRDRIDGDVVASEFEREAVRHADLSRLR